MANVTGQGTSFNLENYTGELFTADMEQTPFLSMIGGLSGGKQTTNKEFTIDSTYSYPEPSQPAISEQASTTAPKAITYTRDQNKNITQIFQETVDITYRKLTNSGRLSGLNTAGQSNNVASEEDFQKGRALIKIARDIEHTFLNGTYAEATDETTADKTRGMFELCSTGNTVTVTDTILTKAMVNKLLRDMATNGALFSNMVFHVNAFQKQVLTDIYGLAPADRNVGGLNISQIETDFAKIGIAYNPFVPADKLLLADMSYIAPVFGLVPNKGFLFYEPLAKKGASESGHIYGEIGLDHGNKVLHGSITGLKVE